MNRPRILLLGRSGQVGWELERALAPLGQTLALSRAEADLTAAPLVAERIVKERPLIVINAAAYTAVDHAESEPERAHLINSIAPGILAAAANRIGAWFIHFSTDYVFDGAKCSAYVEADPAAPLNVYGQSKLDGERTVQDATERHLVVRLSWVYALRGHNFLLTMQRLARERAELRVVNDQFGAPTWARIVAEAMVPVVMRLLAGEKTEALAGVYHLSCRGRTSWHGFAERVVNAMPAAERKARVVTAITSADYPTPARRPLMSVLDCSRFEARFGVRLPGWEETLSRALKSD